MADDLKPILCYVSPAGNNKISDWYDDLSATEKAATDEFLKNVRRTANWKMPDYRGSLKGHKGIGELRWPAEKKEHRLIGYLTGGKFVALIGCIHKQKIYTPANALETADKRKKDIENKVATVVPYDF
jgi:hypothetical protein